MEQLKALYAEIPRSIALGMLTSFLHPEPNADGENYEKSVYRLIDLKKAVIARASRTAKSPPDALQHSNARQGEAHDQLNAIAKLVTHPARRGDRNGNELEAGTIQNLDCC